jgi:hypothetical protein
MRPKAEGASYAGLDHVHARPLMFPAIERPPLPVPDDCHHKSPRRRGAPAYAILEVDEIIKITARRIAAFVEGRAMPERQTFVARAAAAGRL